jgi:uncharacterized protein (TIGR00730 family)
MTSGRRPVNAICLFAGSARRSPAPHLDIAAAFGAALAREGIDLVYGGGSIGMMGAVADAALAGGARVVGVVPRGLFAVDEVHHDVELIEVESLHVRKQVMLELAEAFVVLPGGFGTLDELSEVLTWAQLGIHAKPIVLLDVDGYWDGLTAWLNTAIGLGYVYSASREHYGVARDARGVLDFIANYEAPPAPRSLAPDQT